MEKIRFPGGLFERVWLVSLVTGIILKALKLIGWLGFFVIITIWPVIVVIMAIFAIIAISKMEGMSMDGVSREEGEDNDKNP